MLDNTVNQDHADDELPVQPWHFTFHPGSTDPNTGEPIDGRYARVVGTYETARAQVADWLHGEHQIVDQCFEGEAGDPAGDLWLYEMPTRSQPEPASDEPDDDDSTAEQAAATAAIGAQLAAHLANAGYDYASYQINDGPVEHNWRTTGAEHEISLLEGRLVYDLQGVTLLTALVASPQQIAILLSAYGVAPVEMTTAYELGQLAAAADIDATLGARTYERDMGEPAPGPLPAGVDGHPINGRDGGAA